MSKGEETEIQRLQKQIQHIQQENKVLIVRAQALQVLGKVLQESQDDNTRLKQEVGQLKTQLIEKGIDPSQAQLSMVRLNSDDGSQSTIMTEQTSGAYSSMSRGVAGHDYVNVTTVSGPQSISAGYPSLLNGDLHSKDVRAEFQQIRGEVDQLMNNTRQLCEKIKLSAGEDGELQVKLAQLSLRLKEYAKEAGARETLSGALVYEEEQIRDKLLAMEAEQASHENVAQQLKDKLGESKEELERIHDEAKFFQEALVVQKDPTLSGTGKVASISGSERTGSRSSVEQPIAVKSPVLNSGHGTCQGCDKLQRQLSELQRQVLEATKERDESLRLKEEILDVNHKWDQQYKMLQDATSREITDLKKQLEGLRSSQRQSRIDQQTLNPTNPARNFQGGSVEQRPPQLAAPPTAALQTIPNPSQHVSSWAGVAPNPQGISPDFIDEIEVLKQQLRVYADDFATERNDRERVQTEKEALREELNAVKEQVQTLEQQLQIYEEDFKREKREKEALQQQMRAAQGAYGGYHDMSQRARAVAEQQARVQAIREVHDREKNRLMREQQEFQQHVFAKQTTPQRHTAPNPQYIPGYGGGHMGYSTQQLLQQPWDRQNYPLVTRGTSVAGNRASYPTRGPIGYPSDQRSTSESMFRGGEVLPDRGEDVVDSASDVKGQGEAAAAADEREIEDLTIKECPRCLRMFDEDEKDSILKHIEKCIS